MTTNAPETAPSTLAETSATEQPDLTSTPATNDNISDLIDALDNAIDALTEPLFNHHPTGEDTGLDIACHLGLHLLDRGCSIVARSGLPLSGLDVAIVAAQDRAEHQIRTPRPS